MEGPCENNIERVVLPALGAEAGTACSRRPGQRQRPKKIKLIYSLFSDPAQRLGFDSEERGNQVLRDALDEVGIGFGKLSIAVVGVFTDRFCYSLVLRRKCVLK